jgi:MoxR-like ATPase
MRNDEGPAIASVGSHSFAAATALVEAASAVIRGKKEFLKLLVAAVLAKGHVLIEDLPGLGKTTTAKTLSRLISRERDESLKFKRIQFTPDLLPYDITGVDVFDPQTRSFRFVPGPIFADIVLADEINRATPKVQSALLEAMAEGQVTVGASTHRLSDPFWVIATQNPVESEGTFPLPIAQLDRFMMRLSLGYPDRTAERAILDIDPAETALPTISPVIDVPALLAARSFCEQVFCHPDLLDAITDIVRETRNHRGVSLGVSPRGSLHYMKAAKAFAAASGRDYVIDEDLVETAVPVLAHRLKLRDPRIRPEALVRELCLGRIDKVGK